MRPHGCSFPNRVARKACQAGHLPTRCGPGTGRLQDRLQTGRAMQWTAASEKVREDRVRKPCPLVLSNGTSLPTLDEAAGRGGADGKGYEKVPYGVRRNSDPGFKERDKEDAAGYAMSEEELLCWHREPIRESLQETPFRVNDDGLRWSDRPIFGGREYIDLRDWKTTSEEDAPASYYEEQLKFYAYAMMFTGGKRLREEDRIGINYLRSPERDRISTEMSVDMIFETGCILGRSLRPFGIFEAKPERCPVCGAIFAQKHV